MQLPQSSASSIVRFRYGRYVIRRLRRAKLDDLAELCEKANASLLTASRAEEDAGIPVQDALADRDIGDDDLDETAKDTRHDLAARSRDAAAVAPYTLIFPDGIDYYTEAPLDLEVARYRELHKRLETNLPASDKLRKGVLPKLHDLTEAYLKAESALAAARTSAALAATHLDSVTSAWNARYERTYGALIERLGKSAAERFFPATKSRAAKTPKTP